MLQHGLLNFIPTEIILSHSSKIGNKSILPCISFLCVKKSTLVQISKNHPVTLVIVIIISITEEKK